MAVVHTTQCPYCIRTHTRIAHQKGARQEPEVTGCTGRRSAEEASHA
ncbi:MAG: carboxymuconolactone decarboxylase family protein [Mycobacterium leprae]